MSDYIYIIVGKGTSAVAQMVMLLLLAARVEPEQLAPLLAIYSLGAVVAAVGDLGLGTLAARERAYGNAHIADLAISYANRLAALVGIVGTAALGLLAFGSPALLPSVPLFIWATAERATETRGLRLIADGRVGRVATLNAMRRLLGLSLFIVGQMFLPVDWSFTIGLAMAAVLGQAMMIRWTPLLRQEAPVGRLKLIRRALPFTFTSLSGQLRNMDVPIVTAFVPGAAAAAYGFGARMASPVMLIFSSVSGLVLVRARRADTAKLRMIVSALLGGPAILSGLLIVLNPQVSAMSQLFIHWMTEEITRTMVVVASSYMFAGASIIFGSICIAFRLQRRLVVTNVVTVVVSLVGVTISAAITQSGIVSATWSLVCYAAQASVLALFVLSRGKRNYHG